jgi:hypothetical protein
MISFTPYILSGYEPGGLVIDLISQSVNILGLRIFNAQCGTGGSAKPSNLPTSKVVSGPWSSETYTSLIISVE